MKPTNNENYMWCDMGSRLTYKAKDGAELKVINTRDGRVRKIEIVKQVKYELQDYFVVDCTTKPEVGMYIIRQATPTEVAIYCKMDSDRVKFRFQGRPNVFKKYVKQLKAWYETEPILVLLAAKEEGGSNEKV